MITFDNGDVIKMVANGLGYMASDGTSTPWARWISGAWTPSSGTFPFVLADNIHMSNPPNAGCLTYLAGFTGTIPPEPDEYITIEWLYKHKADNYVLVSDVPAQNHTLDQWWSGLAVGGAVITYNGNITATPVSGLLLTYMVFDNGWEIKLREPDPNAVFEIVLDHNGAGDEVLAVWTTGTWTQGGDIPCTLPDGIHVSGLHPFQAESYLACFDGAIPAEPDQLITIEWLYNNNGWTKTSPQQLTAADGITIVSAPTLASQTLAVLNGGNSMLSASPANGVVVGAVAAPVQLPLNGPFDFKWNTAGTTTE
jgi:hypothetical protein